MLAKTEFKDWSLSIMSMSYHFVIYDFADIDGGLGVLSEILLLLEKKALTTIPTEICLQ